MSDEIRVTPDRLNSDADAIRDRANRIKSALAMVDSEISKMGPGVFSGQRADALRARYRRMYDDLQNFPNVLEKFASFLDGAADAFRIADSQ